MTQSLSDTLLRDKIEKMELYSQFFTQPVSLLPYINLQSID